MRFAKRVISRRIIVIDGNAVVVIPYELINKRFYSTNGIVMKIISKFAISAK